MDPVKILIILILISSTRTTMTRKKILHNNIEIQPQIVNGSDAKIEEFPFIVSVQNIVNETHSYHSCGGSILNAYWILTAALCLEYDDRPENYLVEYATTMISDGLNGAKYALVEDVIYHENFDPEKMNDDIGLIKLQAPMQLFSAGWRVKLPLRNEYFPTGTPAVLAGWGTLGSGRPISEQLQKVDLVIFSQKDCSKIHNPEWIFYENICAGSLEGWSGQCSGDAGGPLLVDGILVGIASWSTKPCTTPPYPGVFTNVVFYIDWIEQKTGLNLKLRTFLQVRD